MVHLLVRGHRGVGSSAKQALRPSIKMMSPRPAPMRIGLFGGTFDPPHVGHLVTAVNVGHALSLDLVILMVANVPWQKEGSRQLTDAADRLAMVEAAVAEVPGLVAGRTEIEAGGPSYTADTLTRLGVEFPGADLFTIMGADAAAGLLTWDRCEEVITRSSLVAVDRPGAQLPLPDGIDWIRVEVPRLEVSSTDLRSRFADGRPLDYLVTRPVLAVIAERSLYGARPDLWTTSQPVTT
jgi:nicotinate-nucleotide adenylyltransferase